MLCTKSLLRGDCSFFQVRRRFALPGYRRYFSSVPRFGGGIWWEFPQHMPEAAFGAKQALCPYLQTSDNSFLGGLMAWILG